MIRINEPKSMSQFTNLPMSQKHFHWHIGSHLPWRERGCGEVRHSHARVGQLAHLSVLVMIVWIIRTSSSLSFNNAFVSSSTSIADSMIVRSQ